MGAFHVFTRFQVSGAALTSMLESPDGPVGTMLLDRAIRVRERARELCPVETPESAARHQTPGASRGMPPREPGRLRDSIEVYRSHTSRALYFEVGSKLPYATHIEFHPAGGFLRGALSSVVGAHALRPVAVR